MELSWTIVCVLVLAISTELFAQNRIKTSFSCDGRVSGYYADVQSGCQIYHMCDGLGRQFSYSCPNATLFQQRMLICDHWYMVNCSKSEEDYSANLLIGQREKKFVEDSEKHPYQRTPRPDLLSQPGEEEFNIIYRTGRAQLGTNLNLVGVDSYSQQQNDTTVTDQPTYFLPSRWSTEFSKLSVTSKPIFDPQTSTSSKRKVNKNDNQINKKYFNNPFLKNIENSVNQNSRSTGNIVTRSPTFEPPTSTTPFPVNFKSNFKATTPVFPLSVQTDSTPIPINFKSNFKATTPVFPLHVEAELETTTPVLVNFKSNFKATTPVFPLVVEETTSVPVNFKSDFKATTPQFPSAVEVTPPSISEDQLPPKLDPLDTLNINPDILVNLEKQVSKGKGTERSVSSVVDLISPPSAYYEPPKLNEEDDKRTQPDIFINSRNSEEVPKKSSGKVVNKLPVGEKQWKDLRKVFLIPDYEFPLDTGSRPGYDEGPSSYKVDPVYDNTRQNKK